MTVRELLRPPRPRVDRLQGCDLRLPPLGDVGPHPLVSVILFRRPELLSPASWPVVHGRAAPRAVAGGNGDRKKRDP